MGLDKFVTGRIYQMHFRKSYLAAHTTWEDPEAHTTWLCCKEEKETLDHAILHCPPKSDICLLHLPGVDDTGPESTLCTTADVV
ncbi:hypothetical protein L873DRAFT_1820932, partial [Choiromyces venosus 120613-1]